jgi:hypothetical protein
VSDPSTADLIEQARASLKEPIGGTLDWQEAVDELARHVRALADRCEHLVAVLDHLAEEQDLPPAARAIARKETSR